MGKRIFLSLWICVLAFSMSALAQETTGGVQGTVKDPTGAVIPGATVEVSSPALIGKKTATTDSGGFFHIEQLPPGIYSITVNAAGFAPSTQNNLELRTGALPTVNFTVQVGGITQEVSVSAEAAVIDITQSKVQTNVTEEVLQAIPKLRSFQSVIPFAPGARQEPLQSARQSRLGGFQINGATDAENVYMIDGVNATDVQNGGVGKDFQTDFIQEVQVKSSSFEAEYGGALGGVINAVPKRGSNTWHGELKGYFQTAALDANDPCSSGMTAGLNGNFRNTFGLPSGYEGETCGLRPNPATSLNPTTRLDARPEFYVPKKDSRHIVEPGYEIGGPLFKDRLWLFSSYIPTIDSTERTTNYQCPTSNPTCTFAGPRRLGQDFVQHNSYNRLDYRLTNQVRLFGSWNYAYSRTTGQLGAPDSAFGQTNRGATTDPTTFRPDVGTVNPLSVYSVSGDWTPTSALLVNGRFGYFFSNNETRGTPSGIRYQYDPSGPGGALNAATRDVNNNPFPANAPFNTAGFSNMPSNFATVYDAFKRKSFNTDLSYFVGNFGGGHNFKFGYFWQAQRNDVLKTANTAHVIIDWGISYSPVTSTTACAAIQASNARGLCEGQYGYFWTGSNTTSQTGFANATDQAFYLQDSWIVGTSGLTINAGVRFDHEHNPAFDPTRFPDINFGWGSKIAPRIGGAYDLLHNGKVKLYGSWGKFFDIMKLGLTRGSFGSDYWHECVYALDVLDYTTITPTLTTGAGCPPSGPAPGVNARFIENVDFRATKADPRDPAIMPNMKPVQSNTFTAGADWSITPAWVLETRYTRSRLINTIEDMSITDNLGFYIGNPGTTFADVLHRPVVIPNDNGDNYLNTVPFCAECPGAVKPIRRFDSLEFRLTRRAGTRLYGTVSYTYSKLRGNYSGLVDTDPTDGNGGRHSPNNGRAFDLPTMTYLPSGKIDDGPLATDRPHTAKVWGYYRLPWLGQETSFGVSQAFYQGTPISSCLPVVGTSSACQWAEGRGNFTRFHRDPSGNIVSDGVVHDARTDIYLQTDLSVRHEIRVSKDHENYKLVVEGNGYNLFNQHAATSYYQFVIPTNLINPTRPSRFSGDPQTDWAKVMNGYNYVDALNGTGAFGGAAAQQPLTLASRYGLPQTFQIARQFRFAVRFMF
jgi:hypothetical protein